METCDHIVKSILRRPKVVEGGTPSCVSANNFIAGPARGNRKGAGAPKGNRNARTHGMRSAVFVARRRAARDLIRASKEFANGTCVMVDAGVDPNAHCELFEALVAQSRLSLRKLEGARIAKGLTNDQNFPEQSTKSAEYRETRDEIHLVQPDAVAVSAGRLPGEEPLGVGGYRLVAVRSGEESRGLQHLYGPSGIRVHAGLRRYRRERASPERLRHHAVSEHHRGGARAAHQGCGPGRARQFDRALQS